MSRRLNGNGPRRSPDRLGPAEPRPADHLIDAVAKAIYRTHWQALAPAWDNVSADVRDWVRSQALAALAAVNAERRAIRDRQRQRGRTRAAGRAATERAVAPPVEHPIEQPAELTTRPPGSVPLSRPR